MACEQLLQRNHATERTGFKKAHRTHPHETEAASTGMAVCIIRWHR